jgi:hypothetical protein
MSFVGETFLKKTKHLKHIKNSTVMSDDGELNYSFLEDNDIVLVDEIRPDAGNFDDTNDDVINEPTISEEQIDMIRDMLLYATDLLESSTRTKIKKQIKNFQPNNTQKDNYNRRYLAWNHVGIITMREDKDCHYIQIHFQNCRGSLKDCSFRDVNDKYSLASLSFEGAVFANQSTEIDNELTTPQGSTVFYHAFPTSEIFPNESFKAKLPTHENANAVAVGKGWIAVTTSAKFLRILSSTGIPHQTIWLGGNVVCLCGYHTKLAVLFSFANSEILVDMYDINWEMNKCRVHNIAKNNLVPLTLPHNDIIWAGFSSDLLILSVVDSSGQVSVMHKISDGVLGWAWSPVLQISANIVTSFWPTMFHKNTICGVRLGHGGSVPQRNHNQLYPITIQLRFKPSIVHFYDMQNTLKGVRVVKANEAREAQDIFWMRLAMKHTECLQIDTLLMNRSHVSETTAGILKAKIVGYEQKLDHILLKKLQQALVNSKIERGYDLVSMLNTEKALYVAGQLGDHFDHNTVSELAAWFREIRIFTDVKSSDQLTDSDGEFSEPLENLDLTNPHLNDTGTEELSPNQKDYKSVFNKKFRPMNRSSNNKPVPMPEQMNPFESLKSPVKTVSRFDLPDELLSSPRNSPMMKPHIQYFKKLKKAHTEAKLPMSSNCI